MTEALCLLSAVAFCAMYVRAVQINRRLRARLRLATVELYGRPAETVLPPEWVRSELPGGAA